MEKVGLFSSIVGSVALGYAMIFYGVIPTSWLDNTALNNSKLMLPIFLAAFAFIVSGYILVYSHVAGLKHRRDELERENKDLEDRVDDCERYIKTTKQWVKDMVNPREEKVREIVRDEMSKQFKHEASAYFHEDDKV